LGIYFYLPDWSFSGWSGSSGMKTTMEPVEFFLVSCGGKKKSVTIELWLVRISLDTHGNLDFLFLIEFANFQILKNHNSQ
jgi:hypothetical protein